MLNRSLIDIFNEHAETIDPRFKKNYLARATRLKKHLAEKEIPEEVLTRAKYPQFFPYFRQQLNYDSCGLNALRNVFMASHGAVLDESILIQIAERQFGIRIDGVGVPNIFMPRLICYFNETISREHLKIFTSAEGTLEQLDYLTANGYTPIINSYRPEIGENTTHYEAFFGFRRESQDEYGDVYGILYNSYWQPKGTRGFHKVRKDDFMRYWHCDGQCGDPKGYWFVGAVNGLPLPHNFKGELLISP